MIKNSIKRNEIKQIKKLKKYLMPRTNSFKSDYSGSSKFSKEFNKIKNSEVRGIFERYNYVILEIKLNKTKIMELIHQLKRAKNILEKIDINKKILYVGFINSKDLDKDISSEVGDLNIIIYGLKKNMFSSTDMRKF